MRYPLLTAVFFAAIFALTAPFVVLAENYDEGKESTNESAYVPCGTEDADDNDIVDNPCGFGDVVELSKRLIMGWIIAGVTFATMGFAYAGYLYITAMGSEEKISHAHSIFTKTTFGFVFMLSAWLIVYTIEKIFLRPHALENSFLYDGE